MSKVEAERRIEQDPLDIEAWNLLLRHVQKKPIGEAVNFYESLVSQFPNGGRYWKVYIEHQLRSKNFEQVEKLFERCLVKVLSIDLWKCYLHYMREKSNLPGFREKMAQAYDFALESVGLDFHCYSIYAEYANFLKTVPAQGQYKENVKIATVRKVYHRGISTPIQNVEQLWAEYCAYEKSVNERLAERLISERNRDYQSARRVGKLLETQTRGLHRQVIQVPTSRSGQPDLRQLQLWKNYIQWEKDNPLGTEDSTLLIRRVSYAYEQALLCLGHFPEVWLEAHAHLADAALRTSERGDAKLATKTGDHAASLLDRAISTLMKESPLLHFALADFEEARMRYKRAEQIYVQFIEHTAVDPTLAYIQWMKFARRTESIAAARHVFKKARDDARCDFHVYVCAALLEYYCQKDSNVPVRIFDLGLKKFGGEREYARAYIDFLSHLNQDNNSRVLFERILTSGNLPVEHSLEIWNAYLQFEATVGDLPSIIKVDKRRRDSLTGSAMVTGRAPTLLHLDRYKFLDLVPCSMDQLRVFHRFKPFATSSLPALPGSMPSSHHGVLAAQPASMHTAGAGPSAAANRAADGSASASRLRVEEEGISRPNVEQMVPFKPRVFAHTRYFPVSGGEFAPPPAVSHLLSMLPPPTSFHGPFVLVDALMQSFLRADFEPRVDQSAGAPAQTNEACGKLESQVALTLAKREPMDNGESAGAPHDDRQLSNVKKDFYQLLATTPDPNQVLMSGPSVSAARRLDEPGAFAREGSPATKRPRSTAGSADDAASDTGVQGSAPASDVYRMRMQNARR